ncbi:WD repeat-containing protein 74 isoform X2 [Rhodamnia argentea]|uniref:WD repeat-containing protein 74 isoform X2 n=1 Tax=Rhodamnia argentea TaxID=178133 RepID=A0ABM3HB91_9MYRT|nr:WD repeat-containing protein 74 isoform X2 [Rhodamnia argentea]
MPRTTTVESPGCPPFRALTFDVLGLVKVVEARGKQGGVPKVVERWGEPESRNCVLAASIDGCKRNPMLAVARKCGKIELLDPLNGDTRVVISDAIDTKPEDDPIIGLHVFRRERTEERSNRSCTLLSCTTKGNAVMRSFEVTDSPEDCVSTSTTNKWNVCAAGSVLCCKVDGSENYAVAGGKGVELNIWDLDKCSRMWTAKSPPKNNLGIFTPTWFTSATFLCKDDHRKVVAGTNSRQVRLYDISAQRRPVLSFDFRETPIKAVTEDIDGYTVYVGNGSGDLASFDMRTGKLLGCFLGKCSGSIRYISRHPDFPVIASCGLDSYLRLWDVKSRQLLSAVFLKQHLNSVLFDSGFADEEPVQNARDVTENEAQRHRVDETQYEDGTLLVKRKKKKKKKTHEEGRDHKTSGKENGGIEKLNRKKKIKRVKTLADDDAL